MQVFFDHRVQIAPGIWESYFRPSRPLDYQAGQYVAVRLTGLESDRRGSSRTFTLTSVPTNQLVSFVSKHPAPGSLYKQRLLELAPDESADIGDAMGDLVLPKSVDIPLVFVAGGIGMASYAAMLKTLIAKNEQRSVALFYALRSEDERIFDDLASAYSLQSSTTVLSPLRLTAKDIHNQITPDAQIYLSGSQPFVEALRQDLQLLGLGHEQIAFDYFDGYVDL